MIKEIKGIKTSPKSAEGKTTTEEIEALLKGDPVVKKAIQKTQANDKITETFVNETLEKLNELLKDETNPFDIKNGFQALAKCINYLAQGLCTTPEMFQAELAHAHKVVAENVMQAIPEEDIDNFSLRRLMMLGGSIIDYVFWREALGDCITAEEAMAMKAKSDAGKVVEVDFAKTN